ncbi:MAG: hypothetical protein K6T86_17205 [Pirellulales bacterium]|nr:hypothetical protein [Pirellulales bacterium]
MTDNVRASLGDDKDRSRWLASAARMVAAPQARAARFGRNRLSESVQRDTADRLKAAITNRRSQRLWGVCSPTMVALDDGDEAQRRKDAWGEEVLARLLGAFAPRRPGVESLSWPLATGCMAVGAAVSFSNTVRLGKIDPTSAEAIARHAKALLWAYTGRQLIPWDARVWLPNMSS